jgi:Adenylate and Guanylate cyclase catalytic domain
MPQYMGENKYCQLNFQFQFFLNYQPIWQTSPLVASALNINVLNYPTLPEIRVCYESGSAVFGGFMIEPPGGMNDDGFTAFFAAYLSTEAQKPVLYEGDPFSNIALPVYGSYEKNDTEVVGMIVALVRWGSYFENVLPEQANGIILVLENPCQGPFTYKVRGSQVEVIGKGDFHDSKFSKYKKTESFSNITKIRDGTEHGMNFLNSYCPISIRIYPSEEYYNEYNSSLPIALTFTVLMVFVFTAIMFLVYDRLVERRQNLVLMKAVQSSAIVSSLFPQNVADRLLQQNDVNVGESRNTFSSKHRLKSMLNGDIKSSDSFQIGHDNATFGSQPIADLFPNTSVLFADISGFTAWSSTREPTQVFLLLQNVYQAFDHIAKRRRVFKVETIGDSYVAVTGLPEPQEQHAVIMARFAVECQQKMHEVASHLDVSLGPGTSGKWILFYLDSCHK